MMVLYMHKRHTRGCAILSDTMKNMGPKGAPIYFCTHDDVGNRCSIPRLVCNQSATHMDSAGTR